MSHGGSLPVVVRVKRKRELAPVDTIVVEAEETPAAKRRARDAALAAELDASLAARSGPDLSRNLLERRGVGPRERSGYRRWTNEPPPVPAREDDPLRR